MTLTEAATVRIHRGTEGYDPDEAGWEPGVFLGSGVFAAPGLVLTCAHVLDGAGEGEGVTVVYEPGLPGRTLAARAVVEAVLGEPDGRGGHHPPDLAVLRLRDAGPHPCVLLAHRPARTESGAEMRYCGWAPRGDRDAVRIGAGVKVGGTHDHGPARQLIRFVGETPREGVSGGPVLDLERGEVVGLVKSKALAQPDPYQRNAPPESGGYFVDLTKLSLLPRKGGLHHELLAAHDRYHGQAMTGAPPAGTWTDAQNRLPATAAARGRDLGPSELTRLLARLATLPPPPDPMALLHMLRGLLRGPGLVARPCLWRDGIGLLRGARGDRASQLELYLQYVVGALETGGPPRDPRHEQAGNELCAWAEELSADLDPFTRSEVLRRIGPLRDRPLLPPADRPEGGTSHEPSAEPPAARTVTLHFWPSGWDTEVVDWWIQITGPGPEALPETVAEDRSGTPVRLLAERAAAELTAAFDTADLDGAPALFRLMVPLGMLRLRPEEWPLGPGGRPLGESRPVVIGCSSRTPSQWQAKRWAAAHPEDGAAGLRAQIVDCDRGNPHPFPPDRDRLAQLPLEAVPVLCRHGDDEEGPASVVEAGFPVSLWRRRGERAAVLDELVGEVCGELHRRAEEETEAMRTAAALPGRVRAWRAAVAAGDTGHFWSAGVTLLYDPPLPEEDPLAAL
ncbi:VMAP-C domain-containing protein [Streptomyces sp. NPDC002644]